VMEKAFEEAASNLKLGEVSEPVKSAFGYHLIKVTELAAGEVKSFDSVKAELTKAYQKSQAESTFNSLGEKLAEVSYENPNSLDAAAKVLGGEVNKTGLFTHEHGEGIAADEKVRAVSFSEDVLKGNNSEPVEIGSDKLVVLRMLSHQPAANKELKEVKAQVIAALQHDKARQKAIATADQIKADLAAGKTMAQVGEAHHLALKKVNGLGRIGSDLAPAVSQAVFKAAKPQPGHPSVVVIDEPAGGKIVANIVKVTEGEITDADKAKQAVIEKNMATAFGKAQFEAVINALQAKADITMHAKKQ